MDSNLQQIINKIKADKGLDLSGYKESTLMRRLERRMKFDGAGSLEEYIRMINNDYHLYWHLISDFFIGVTDFFRDKEICDIVRNEILPTIIDRRLKDKLKVPVRIWSAGCSTGEETYTLAIMIKDIFEERNIKGLPAFVHGTDIMDDKLEIAGKGLYSAEKFDAVDESLREKYFIPQSGGYKVGPEIQIMTRFKKSDIIHSDDYAGFDMIVCRNVLIYFQRDFQENAVKYFHKALRKDGILWLGKSESLWGETEPLFKPVFRKEKIFRRL